ncbi:flagellar hook-basal body complex protein [Bacillus lacus]|uniref:Flagellar hook-basal body complex protein n=1 Tax=Metabacillus lacus TaxID=1983721 RepID=A0A7X2J1M5_9BACI|nr:flagellar hook-basal body protein [Metabacillus lacus]MRX73018.1 flagellar hook-basal body complex protein [Metabacillus lacus]
MLKGFYTAASGMISQQRRTEMLTNNIANVNTPGYKADQSSIRSFPEMLLQRTESSSLPVKNGASFGSASSLGPIPLSTGAYMQEMVPLTAQGDLRETGSNSDLALLELNVPLFPETNQKGMLFFEVLQDDGTRAYTRNSHFDINNLDQLTSGGLPLLSTTGEQIIVKGDFEVTAQGEVLSNGISAGRINVVLADDVRLLMKRNDGLYAVENNGVLQSAVNNPEVSYSIRQGYVEGSNVDVTKNYADMMTAYRAFEANQKVLQAYDRSMEKAVNEIGRLR